MDKEKLEKGIDRIIRQYTINVVTDEISDYTVLDADVITKMSKELADRIEIDREMLKNSSELKSFCKLFKISELTRMQLIKRIAEACPIKIKEDSDDEKWEELTVARF